MKSLREFKMICRFAAQAIGDYRMIEDGDRLLVGLSGGKDSLTLMHVLTHLKRRAPINFKLTAVTFDAGFPGLKLDRLAEYANENGWEHQVIHCPVNELVTERGLEENPCSFCARLRRGYLYRVADEGDYNKLVLGQHLDDVCASLLIGLFRGGGLKTMGPNVMANHGSKRVIRPLIYVAESLIKTLAEKAEYPDFGRCDYEAHVDDCGDRAFLEQLIESLDSRFYNIRKNMLHSMQDLRPEHLLDKKWLNYLEDK